jgi:hypothetical protein
MTKKTILTCVVVLVFGRSFGQYQRTNSYLINEARNLYDKNEFLKAGQKYSEAFKTDYNIRFLDRIGAASSWVHANLYDSVFIQLFKIALDSNFISYNNLVIVPDLIPLHNDKRWESIIEMVRTNLLRREGNLDMSLVAILDSVFQDDQEYRVQFSLIEKKYGKNSKEMIFAWGKQLKNDSINVIKVRKILDINGWLGPNIIGSQGNDILWMVIQHADIKSQENYLPMIRVAAKNGYLSPSKLVLLEDRVALRQGEKQIYGSQIGRDQKTGKYYVRALLDPDNVDKRRAEVGIGKLQDYISDWGITWNLDEYKRRLPEYEDLEKQ